MPLDSAQLNAFATVIDEGSFERAAAVLHVTRSAVSQRIKLLADNSHISNTNASEESLAVLMRNGVIASMA